MLRGDLKGRAKFLLDLAVNPGKTSPDFAVLMRLWFRPCFQAGEKAG